MIKSEKIEIKRMQMIDMEAVMRIKNAENWNQTEDDWQFLMYTNPETCLVATLNNQVIGTVTAINYQNKVAWIGMMLVSKDFRGIGVSKLLLNTIIKKLENCVSIKLDATPAGIPVYKKLGFVEEYEIGRLVSTGLSNMVRDKQDTDDDFNISQILESDISNIVSVDEILFGVNRFNLFRYLLNNRIEICLQIKQENQLKGYIFGRNGSNYTASLIANYLNASELVQMWLINTFRIP